jgi:anti-sigma regulatory factor (Ser/Thr protein kinase)
MEDEVRVPIASDADLVPARAHARTLAERLGFSRTDATLIATAISEVARNIVVHAGRGEIIMTPLYENDRYGLLVVARDSGPGIRDVEAAIGHGFTAKGGLGPRPAGGSCGSSTNSPSSPRSAADDGDDERSGGFETSWSACARNGAA